MRDLRLDLVSSLSSGALRRVVDVAAARGLKISSKTAIRWSTYGKRGVRLPSLRIAGARCTTAAAFDAWLQAIAVAESGVVTAPAGLSPLEAEQVLAAHGLRREARP
jgi:hypothetical protein